MQLALYTSRSGWLWAVQTVRSSLSVYGIKGFSMHFSVWIHQGWLCNSDSSGLKLSVKVTNLCSKLL